MKSLKTENGSPIEPFGDDRGLMEAEIKTGLYEHFKGKKYEVIGVARHSETLEPMVVYKSLYKGDFPEGSLWVRPFSMFVENVLADGKQIPRFRYLGV